MVAVAAARRRRGVSWRPFQLSGTSGTERYIILDLALPVSCFLLGLGTHRYKIIPVDIY
jgi:hypothetical protein